MWQIDDCGGNEDQNTIKRVKSEIFCRNDRKTGGAESVSMIKRELCGYGLKVTHRGLQAL
jgi:hypothetical protein